MSKSKQITKFAIAGKLIAINLKDGNQIKEIRLETYKGILSIKVSKELRQKLKDSLVLGDTVLVEGEKEFNSQNEEIKLKATAIALKQSTNNIAVEPTTQVEQLIVSAKKLADKSSQHTILVCQKSDCQKRGSQTICRLLEENLRDRGLDEQITIKKVGCIKHCKSGPHVVLMPDKTRYSQVKPKGIPELIERHFPPTERPQSA